MNTYNVFEKNNVLIFMPVFRQQDGRNLLMFACYGGHLEVAKYLVDKGLNVNAMNNVSCHIHDE